MKRAFALDPNSQYTPVKSRKIAIQIIAASTLGIDQSADGSEFSIDISRALICVPSNATNVTIAVTKACIPYTW